MAEQPLPRRKAITRALAWAFLILACAAMIAGIWVSDLRWGGTGIVLLVIATIFGAASSPPPAEGDPDARGGRR